jgi:signal transduction histidine kinase
VTESIELLEHNIEEKNVSIKVSDLPQVNIVAAQFRQLFQNLIGNAIKFSRPDTPPVIKIDYQWINGKEASTYDLPPAARYLKVNVSDNGIGFHQEYARKIFHLFSRLNNKNDFEGNGLGLAIAKKIVENHNGAIFATSEADKGSVFSFVIPQ